MKLIFVSAVCSREKYAYIFNRRNQKFIDPAQKFLEQLMRGVASDEINDVVSISSLPVSSSTIDQKLFKLEEEEKDKIRYIYPRFFNGKFSRYITTFISTFWAVRRQLRINNGNNTVIITDPLSYQTSMAARLAGKLTKTKCIAIITDIPTYATGMKNHGYKKIRQMFQTIYERLTLKELYKYDAYINLTKDMDEIVNPRKKPSIVIEGSVDSQIAPVKDLNQTDKKVFLYAGGLYEKYGVGNLVQAFINARLENVQLHLYGSGSYVKRLMQICDINNNVIYKGCVLNTELIEIERNADLLINPRFSNENYTKYSFPSKTLEYMTTGTPVLSTKLSGIPEEYKDYLLWFDGETVGDMQKRLNEVSKISNSDMYKIGKKAQEFVLSNKTNVIQGKRIVEFVMQIV